MFIFLIQYFLIIKTFSYLWYSRIPLQLIGFKLVTNQLYVNMKVRYFFTLLAAMLLMVPNVMAQKKSKKNFKEANLKGIWQMCSYVAPSPDSPSELKPSYTFKVLTDDGRITNFTVIPNKGAIVTGYGSYKQVCDTIYTESIERNIHLPMLNEQVNTLYFDLKEEEDLLYLKFYIEKDEKGNVLDAWYYETWKRVEMPDKYPEDLVR